MDTIRKNRTLKKLRLMFSSSRRSRRVVSPVDGCETLDVSVQFSVDREGGGRDNIMTVYQRT